MSTARASGTPPGGEDPPSEATAGAPDLAALAQDWITLWQSEITALITDRETQDTWQTLAALWAGMMAGAIQAMPRPGPPRPGPAWKAARRGARKCRTQTNRPGPGPR